MDGRTQNSGFRRKKIDKGSLKVMKVDLWIFFFVDGEMGRHGLVLSHIRVRV